MLSQYLNNWQLFTISFGLMLLVSFVMMRQSRSFSTFYVTKRKFSIMELEIPATYAGLVRIIKGLFLLPEVDRKKSIGALKGQLWLDFLFMPLAYGSIFLLCWRVSLKFQSVFGHYIFFAFAVLQVVPWICDIIENVYLLGKIKQGVNIDDSKEALEKKSNLHKAYLVMEAIKWGTALTATVVRVSAICYFWLTGGYTATSLKYAVITLQKQRYFFLNPYFTDCQKK
jgi:hypothetical protein